MKILIDLPDDYAEAMKLMAVKLGRRSRNRLISDLIIAFVHKNPEVLAQARKPAEVEAVNIEHKSLFDGMPVNRYIFTRNDGEEIEGKGRVPMEALTDALGRETSMEEYQAEFKGNRIKTNG